MAKIHSQHQMGLKQDIEKLCLELQTDLMNGSSCCVAIVHMDKKLVVFSCCSNICNIAQVEHHIKSTLDSNGAI